MYAHNVDHIVIIIDSVQPNVELSIKMRVDNEHDRMSLLSHTKKVFSGMF